MKHLYFRHANGEFTLVAKNVDFLSDESIWTKIFCDLNWRNPEFEVGVQNDYYTSDGRHWFDVGARDERYVVF